MNETPWEMRAVPNDGQTGMSPEEAEEARYLKEMSPEEIDAEETKFRKFNRAQADAEKEMEAYWKEEKIKLHGAQASMSYSDWIFSKAREYLQLTHERYEPRF